MQELLYPTGFDFAVSSVFMQGAASIYNSYEQSVLVIDGDPLPTDMYGQPYVEKDGGILVPGTDYNLDGGTFNLLTPQTSDLYMIYTTEPANPNPTSVDVDFVWSRIDYPGDPGTSGTGTKTVSVITSDKLNEFQLPIMYLQAEFSLTDLGLSDPYTVPAGSSFTVSLPDTSVLPNQGFSATFIVKGDPV